MDGFFGFDYVAEDFPDDRLSFFYPCEGCYGVASSVTFWGRQTDAPCFFLCRNRSPAEAPMTTTEMTVVYKTVGSAPCGCHMFVLSAWVVML